MSESDQRLEAFNQAPDNIQEESFLKSKLFKMILIGGAALAAIIIIIVIVVLASKKDKNPDPSPEFQIYLAFGQSNMEGQGTIEEEDLNVTERFKLLAAVDFSTMNRTKGNWYTAIPPICRDYTKLNVADYFGRTMAEKQGEHITIGLIHVAIGGSSLELFDEDTCAEYIEKSPWVQEAALKYNNNTFRTMIDLAKQAQKEGGIIKGFLLHQGESDSGATWWPDMLKKIYERMINELGLKAENTPLLIGEMGREEMGGAAELHNTIIAKVPSIIPNAHIISSDKLTMQDGYHFDSKGYREFGRRYAEKMLSLLK